MISWPAEEPGEELEEPAGPVRLGVVELGDPEHEPHPAGWLYVPDLTAETGWGAHRVPVGGRQARRAVGFRP